MELGKDGSSKGNPEDLAKFFKLTNEDDETAKKRYSQFNPYLIWIPATIGLVALLSLPHVDGAWRETLTIICWAAALICPVLCQIRFGKLQITFTAAIAGIVIVLFGLKTITPTEVKDLGKTYLEKNYIDRQGSRKTE